MLSTPLARRPRRSASGTADTAVPEAAASGRLGRATATNGGPTDPVSTTAAVAQPQLSARTTFISAACAILALMLLSLVAEMTVVGAVRHARDQRVGYDTFRSELALGTAPVGQLDYQGKLLLPGDPVALLEIPRLGVKEVVGEGTTSGVLTSGPGHRRDTVLPGQPGTSVIFGRQAAYGGPFGQIATLHLGDQIRVVTGQGKEVFEVDGIRYAGDTQEVTIDPNASRLTLVTGAGRPYAPSDVVRVDAKLVSKPQPAPPLVLGAGSMLPAEQAMKGDHGVLFSLVLWSQALLVLAIAFVFVRSRWGRWQTWIVAVPMFVLVGLEVAHNAAQLLPNLV